MRSMGAARNNMMSMGMNYGNLEDGTFGDNQEEKKGNAAEESDEGEISDFEYCEEIEPEYDGEINEERCCLSDAMKANLQVFLADKKRWKKLKGLGKGFEGGAKFVPAAPNGNCMFNAISVYTTASKALPLGSDENHNEVRQKCCDYIVTQRGGKLAELLAKRGLDTDEKFDAYIAKKRATTGERFTWSDNITANAIAATQGRGPIMQITYPRWRDGVPRPDIEPKFLILTKSGDRTKLPIFIHYNGINHYNAIVPAQWASVSPRAGMMGRATNSVSPKGRASVSPRNKPAVSPKRGGVSPKRGGVSPKRGGVSPKGGVAGATKGMAALGLGKK